MLLPIFILLARKTLMIESAIQKLIRLINVTNLIGPNNKYMFNCVFLVKTVVFFKISLFIYNH